MSETEQDNGEMAQSVTVCTILAEDASWEIPTICHPSSRQLEGFLWPQWALHITTNREMYTIKNECLLN